MRLSDELRFLPQNVLLFFVQCIMNGLIVLLDTLRMTQCPAILVDDRLEVSAPRVNTQRPRALTELRHTTF